MCRKRKNLLTHVFQRIEIMERKGLSFNLMIWSARCLYPQPHVREIINLLAGSVQLINIRVEMGVALSFAIEYFFERYLHYNLQTFFRNFFLEA
jgi:hypothetical protein